MSTRPFKPTGKLNDGKIPVRERLTLGEEWLAFLTTTQPADASITQRIETKRAFYAGAATFLRLTMGNLDEEHEPTAMDLAYMDNLNNEMLAFFNAIGSAEELRVAVDEAKR